MRTSVAALALVRRPAAAGAVETLAQWNTRWNAFHFVGGHKRPDESFRACCIREFQEELRLSEGRQFRVAAEPLAHLEYVAFSQRADAETAYTIELFEVELVGDAAAVVAADPANRWLSEADLRAGRCGDRRAVSETMLRVLTLAGLTPGEATQQALRAKGLSLPEIAQLIARRIGRLSELPENDLCCLSLGQLLAFDLARKDDGWRLVGSEGTEHRIASPLADAGFAAARGLLQKLLFR